MNTIDYTNQVMTVNSVSENTTGSNALSHLLLIHLCLPMVRSMFLN